MVLILALPSLALVLLGPVAEMMNEHPVSAALIASTRSTPARPREQPRRRALRFRTAPGAEARRAKKATSHTTNGHPDADPDPDPTRAPVLAAARSRKAEVRRG
jgi:hypothetical protein